MIKALMHEIELQKNYFNPTDTKEEIESIYFGGGTPSLLSGNEINKIIAAIEDQFKVLSDAEITLEANPDDLTTEKIQDLKKTKINRLSIGIQSFFDEDLKFMNRAHNAEMAVQCVSDAANAGFKNITIDLIYGIPGMSDERWKQNLKTAFELPVQHLSCYSLTVENRTVLYKMIRDGKASDVNDEVTASHFKILMEQTLAHGFDHYEISNFGKPDFYSQHNSSYWKNKAYLGIGPSAHSYNGVARQWNISANASYILSINKNELPFEEEILTIADKYNEYVMTGLRTKWGVNNEYLLNQFGQLYSDYFESQIQKYIHSNEVILISGIYTLTQTGKFIADRIAADCFWVNKI